MISWPKSANDLLNPPTDFSENLRWRANLTNAWLNTPSIKSELLTISAKHIDWTFKALYYTKDPRCTPSERPFILYPHQKKLLKILDEHLASNKDLLIDKTRDMGVTWTMLGWLLWHWRFDKSFNSLIGSRLEDLIDEKGNLDTHFERIRWLLRNMPEWWLPHGDTTQLMFSETKHIPYMRLMRPDSDNTIIGEAVTQDFSRQGRYNITFIDEAAACEFLDGAWTATADASPTRILVSTPKGLGNKFAKLRRSGKIDVESLHWSQHPVKADGMYCEQHGQPPPETCSYRSDLCRLRSPWYDSECERSREPLEIAQELDINYLGAGNPYFNIMSLERMPVEEPIARGNFVEVDLGVEFRASSNGLWSLWELPSPKLLGTTIPQVQAVIGADVAEGIGDDYSVGVVRDMKDRGLKASIRSKLNTDEFAHELLKAGRFYNNARILCERNGPGLAVNTYLVNHYGNVYYEMMLIKEGMPQTKRFGWVTSVRTKPLMLSYMQNEVRTHSAAFRDNILIEECKTIVVDERGRVNADQGYNDDYVIAWAIAGMGIQVAGPYRPPRRPRQEPQLQTSNLCG